MFFVSTIYHCKILSFPIRGVANSSIAQNLTGWFTQTTCMQYETLQVAGLPLHWRGAHEVGGVVYPNHENKKLCVVIDNKIVIIILTGWFAIGLFIK